MSSPLELVSELWEAIKYNIDPNERTVMADVIVNLLIEHDFEVADIREAFRGDRTMNKALSGYVASHEDEYVDEDTDEPEDRDPD
jgi:hypothetical protein